MTHPKSQYTHCLVGRMVRTEDGILARVIRVVQTPFGPLAVLTDQSPNEAWAVNTLRVEAED